MFAFPCSGLMRAGRGIVVRIPSRNQALGLWEGIWASVSPYINSVSMAHGWLLMEHSWNVLVIPPTLSHAAQCRELGRVGRRWGVVISAPRESNLGAVAVEF
jgi:hypothetical protein